MTIVGFVTTYSHKVKRRKTGLVEEVSTYYHTKSLTPMHAHIRATYPGAETWQDPKRIITHFCVGIPLDKPIVSGGTRIG